MNALKAGAPLTGTGTVSRPCVSRLLMSSCVPGAVETSTSATLSGRPCEGLAKCVYLKVTRLLALMTQEPSPVKIFKRDS